MKMYKKIIAMLVLTAAGMSLCITGCGVNINMGNTGLSYADAENYSVGAAEFSETVEHIEIDWLAGNVTVASHSSDTVLFSEESLAALTEDTQLHYWLDGTTLHMKFCRSGKWRLDGLEKDLTVLVPEDLPLTSLTVKSMSADIHLNALQAESANIGTSSGNVELTDCAVTDIVQADTTSGWVDMSLIEPLEAFAWGTTSGTLQITAPKVRNFSAGSVSGEVSLSVKEEPETLSIKTTSGSIDLALPEDASFTLDYDSTSGDLSSDLPCRTESGQYLFGDGKAEYQIGTVSGDVRITAAK